MAKTNKNSNYVTNKTLVAKDNQAKVKSSQKTKTITKQVLIIAAIVVAVAALITGIVFAFIGCTRTEPTDFIAPIDGAFEVTDVVELEFKGYGTVKVELYGKEAPETVKNFLELVKDGKFDESTLSFSSSSSVDKKLTVSLEHDHEEENHTHTLRGEFADNGFANQISHIAGVLTMAKSGTYSSSPTSFMIMLNDHSGEEDVENESGTTTKYGYDGHYAAFGKVTGGTFSIVEKMASDKNATAGSTSSSTPKAEDELVFGSNRFTITDADIKKEKLEYKFTPEVSGKYVFSSSTFMSLLIEKASDGSAADGAKVALGTEQAADAFKAGVEYELEKGVEYKVTVSVKDQKAGTKYIKVSGNILFVGTNDIEVKDTDIGENAEDVKSYEFTPKLSGVYFFTGEKDKIADRIEIFYNGESIGTDYAYLEKDTKYTIEILLKEGDKKVEAGTYDLDISAPTLTLGDTKLSIPEYDILKEGKAEYYFTPSVDGKYLISNKDLTIEVYDAEGNKLEGDYLDLKKDVSYKVVLTADLSSKLYAGNNTITLTKVSEESAEHKSEYTFVAEDSGKYIFTAPSGVSVEVYSGTTKQEPADGKYALIAGKSYIVKLVSPEAEVKDQAFEIKLDSVDEGTKRVVNYVSYTINIQDTVLAADKTTNKNELTITQAEIDAKTSEFTFVAATNGPFSIIGYYQELDENGNPKKNESGGNSYTNAKLTILDKDGNELEGEYAMLTKGETYKVVLKTDLIKKGSVCTITISKIAPKISGAKIVVE